jgi:hypothetical protein
MVVVPAGDPYALVKTRTETKWKLAKLSTPLKYAMWHRNHGIQLLSHCNIKHFFSNVFFLEPGAPKRKRFIDRWLLDGKKMFCQKIVVDPTHPPGPMPLNREFYFNIFPGIKAANLPPVSDAEAEVLAQPFFKHVYEDLVSDPNRAAWFLKWFAVPIQCPQNKNLVAIVMNGEDQLGAGIIADFFTTEILGFECSHKSWDRKAGPRLFSRYSDEAVCKVFFHFTQEFKDVEKFRSSVNNLIMSPIVRYCDKKQKCIVEMKNLANVYMTTHNTTEDMICWRYTLFQASNQHAGDLSYYNNLREHLASPRVARAVYQVLMRLDLSDFNPRSLPPPVA